MGRHIVYLHAHGYKRTYEMKLQLGYIHDYKPYKVVITPITRDSFQVSLFSWVVVPYQYDCFTVHDNIELWKPVESLSANLPRKCFVSLWLRSTNMTDRNKLVGIHYQWLPDNYPCASLVDHPFHCWLQYLLMVQYASVFPNNTTVVIITISSLVCLRCFLSTVANGEPKYCNRNC